MANKHHQISTTDLQVFWDSPNYSVDNEIYSVGNEAYDSKEYLLPNELDAPVIRDLKQLKQELSNGGCNELSW